MNTIERVTSWEELTDLQGTPGRLAENKVIHYLDDHCINFIDHSPFLVLSTSDREGNCDSSPRGDAPGFVYILDSNRLVIPERRGNRRMDSMKNLLENPNIGLLFLIPDVEETLRMNGTAYITKDERILEKLEANGHIPNVAIVVEVAEAFIHCAKALKRSHLWNKKAWPNLDNLTKPAKILASHVKLEGVDEASVARSLEESYTKRLY